MLLAFLALSFSPPTLATEPGLEEESSATSLEDVAAVGLVDLEGGTVTLGALPGSGPLVLAYTGVGCPISGKYAARLTRLTEEYGDRGVRFRGVNANPQDSLRDVATEVRELDLGLLVLKDPRQELSRRLGARTTTEVFLFDEGGALRYRGAIDDQYDLGAGKPEPRRHYLVDALEAVLAGQAPPVSETEAPGCILTLLPPEEQPELVTWSAGVAPILEENCTVCHRRGGVAPFSLEGYDEARGWAEMIASVVEERRMPPWNASPEFDGVFANERRLTERERSRLLAWIADGMPRGAPPTASPSRAPARAQESPWSIGEPDAIIAMERLLRRDGTSEPLAEPGFEVPREGVVDYRYFVADTSFPEDRWLRSLEVLPGAPDVVHHVLVIADDPDDGKPLRIDGESGYLAVAVPGDTSVRYPPGYAKRLPAGARLVFQLHYTPNGKRRFDRSRLGLVFADEPPVFEVKTESVVNEDFRIPPGAPAFEVRGEKVLERDVGLLAFFPHMHTRGKDFEYVAHFPDGERRSLLRTDYDFNWQESYVFHDPLLLPAGTRLECIGHFDNSPENPNNPDPGRWVEWGDQTWEEMFIGYYDHVVPLE